MDCGELLCGSPDYDPVDLTEVFVIDDLESI